MIVNDHVANTDRCTRWRWPTPTLLDHDTADVGIGSCVGSSRQRNATRDGSSSDGANVTGVAGKATNQERRFHQKLRQGQNQ
jgi:hypothetical protein